MRPPEIRVEERQEGPMRPALVRHPPLRGFSEACPVDIYFPDTERIFSQYPISVIFSIGWTVLGTRNGFMRSPGSWWIL